MTQTMLMLIVAAIAFVGSHFLLSGTPLRGVLSRSLTEAGYLGFFSGLALATMIWFVWAYADAPYEGLWVAGPWLKMLTWVIMIPAVLFAILGFATPNPTAVQAERLFSEPDTVTGILRVTRHPVFWGIGLWAIAHFISNGDVASLIFFGALALLAYAGAASQEARKRQQLGRTWDGFEQTTSFIPFAAIIAGRNKFVWREIGLWRVLLAVIAYVALIKFHELVIGVDPIPH
ncbi:MAG: NnrU family protein [Pseudomonadota bacterium]